MAGAATPTRFKHVDKPKDKPAALPAIEVDGFHLGMAAVHESSHEFDESEAGFDHTSEIDNDESDIESDFNAATLTDSFILDQQRIADKPKKKKKKEKGKEEGHHAQHHAGKLQRQDERVPGRRADQLPALSVPDRLPHPRSSRCWRAPRSSSRCLRRCTPCAPSRPPPRRHRLPGLRRGARPQCRAHRRDKNGFIADSGCTT
jgi:hypothetical protein